MSIVTRVVTPALSNLFPSPNGGQVTAYGGRIVDFSGPSGSAGLYTPASSQALVYNSSISGFTSSEVNKDSSGFIYPKTGESNVTAMSMTLPAITATMRVYELRIVFSSSAVSNSGARLEFNYQDADNYWTAGVYRSTSTNDFRLYVDQRVGGTNTPRGNVSLGTTVGLPAVLTLRVYDSGDDIRAVIEGFEIGNSDSLSMQNIDYYVASRPLKDQTGLRQCFNLAPHDFCKVQNMQVFDI